MYEDTFAYATDLVTGRVNEVMWKTSGFLWRRISNLRVLVIIWDLIKHGIHVTVHGMKELYREGKWAIGEQKQKFSMQYEEVSYSKQRKMQRVRKDYIKFIPFSFFIVVPGAELLLPPWLLIFPNSVPS